MSNKFTWCLVIRRSQFPCQMQFARGLLDILHNVIDYALIYARHPETYDSLLSRLHTYQYTVKLQKDYF